MAKKPTVLLFGGSEPHLKRLTNLIGEYVDLDWRKTPGPISSLKAGAIVLSSFFPAPAVGAIAALAKDSDALLRISGNFGDHTAKETIVEWAKGVAELHAEKHKAKAEPAIPAVAIPADVIAMRSESPTPVAKQAPAKPPLMNSDPIALAPAVVTAFAKDVIRRHPWMAANGTGGNDSAKLATEWALKYDHEWAFANHPKIVKGVDVNAEIPWNQFFVEQMAFRAYWRGVEPPTPGKKSVYWSPLDREREEMVTNTLYDAFMAKVRGEAVPGFSTAMPSPNAGKSPEPSWFNFIRDTFKTTITTRVMEIARDRAKADGYSDARCKKPAAPIVVAEAPVKRGPGRPRKIVQAPAAKPDVTPTVRVPAERLSPTVTSPTTTSYTPIDVSGVIAAINKIGEPAPEPKPAPKAEPPQPGITMHLEKRVSSLENQDTADRLHAVESQNVELRRQLGDLRASVKPLLESHAALKMFLATFR